MAFAVPLIASAAGASAGVAGTLGTIASIAGTAFSVLGSLQSSAGAKQQAQAAAQSARYNAAVAANNATIAKQNSAWAGENAEKQSAAALAKTRAEVGAIKANQAASGIAVDSGSALDVRSSAKELGQLSAIDIRTKAARQAYGYDTEAAGYQAQSNLGEAQAKNELAAGKIASNSALVGGLSTAASGFSDYLSKRSL